MSKKNILFDITWDVNKYKSSYDSEHWDLCRTFMETHKTKYAEQKLVHLTEAFYQIGVYGSSYDPKTTRMVSALSIEVLEKFLELHPGALKHPFNQSQTDANKTADTKEAKKDVNQKSSQSIWDVSVDSSIIVNVLPRAELESLLKGFVNIYDIRKVSTMNDNKVSILEESFKRSKFGPCHWHKENTNDIFTPIRLSLKWKSSLLAQAEGKDESNLKTRIAQALLSKLAVFSPGIEAKWNYYRDGRIPEIFENPNPRRSHLYKILRRSDFKAMEEITSFVDTFANSDSFGEIIFGMDFSSQDRKHILNYIEKSWGSKLTHRTVNKPGVKGKGEVTHLCIYQNRTGEELKRWLDQDGGENIRYRLVPPGEHRRAGPSDDNVREDLKSETDGSKNKEKDQNIVETVTSKGDGVSQESKKDDSKLNNQAKVPENKEVPGKGSSKVQEAKATGNPDDLGNVFKEFVLFYNANQESKIDKDDWFSALCDSFKISEYGPLEVVIEKSGPIRTKCTLKWNEMTLASAEGLTETQAKTGATLQLISKMESFTYIVQAKDEYFFDGKVPSFIEKPGEKKSDFYRVYKREELPSYYSIFQTIDEFVKKQSYGEIIFGQDFTWDLKNEIIVYLEAKKLGYRTFTSNNQDPPSHIAVFHSIKPAELKKVLLENGGENEKFKLIPPPKTEPLHDKPDQAQKPKDKAVDKLPLPPVAPPKEDPPPPPPPPLVTPPKVAEKRKLPEKEKEPDPEVEGNKIQINLKKFKKDKVEYPEDTGGDFPGLILWLGITKNSKCQRSLYMNLVESFKMSKYGELTVEESEENVWGRKEPFKKCVIKSGRKVLAVGLGETKTEAKHSASLQVLRHLRKHCYAIQAKESYFKDGKAPPYAVTPDPKKENVYRLAKKEQFKDRASLIKFIDNFSKQVSEGEVIFGDNFTYDERETISEHCNKINLGCRLMKCQSVNKGQHSHVAIYHQRPPPAIKADLMKTGGENDLYRLISPGQKITKPNNDKYRNISPMESLKKELLQSGGQNDHYRLILPGCHIDSLRTYYCPSNCHPEEDIENTSQKNETEDNKILKTDSISEAKVPENVDEVDVSPTKDVVGIEPFINGSLESKTSRGEASEAETPREETEESGIPQRVVEETANSVNNQEETDTKQSEEELEMTGLEVTIEESESNQVKAPELITLAENLMCEHKKDSSPGSPSLKQKANEDTSREGSPEVVEIEIINKQNSRCAEVITLGSSTDEETTNSSEETPVRSDSFALNIFNQIRNRLDQLRGLDSPQRGSGNRRARGNRRSRGNQRFRPFQR